jgi:hypothetical protein
MPTWPDDLDADDDELDRSDFTLDGDPYTPTPERHLSWSVGPLRARWSAGRMEAA